MTNYLILSYERLVLSIVNKYANNYNRDDLYQVAMKKLNEVALNFNPDLGVKFSSYAYKHILGEILDYIRKDRSIHISREIITISSKIKIASEHFYKSFGRNPNTLELSKILKIDEDKIVNVLNTNLSIDSLEKSIDEESNVTLADKIYKEDKISKDDLISLKDALSELSNNDRKLIYERYFEDKTQTEIAKEMNLSQVKVYRMERKILDELNSKMKVA